MIFFFKESYGVDSNSIKSFNIDAIVDSFDCSTSICDYAWIIRDHRDLLKNIVGATCDNEIPFDKLDPINDFKECL